MIKRVSWTPRPPGKSTHAQSCTPGPVPGPLLRPWLPSAQPPIVSVKVPFLIYQVIYLFSYLLSDLLYESIVHCMLWCACLCCGSAVFFSVSRSLDSGTTASLALPLEATGTAYEYSTVQLFSCCIVSYFFFILLVHSFNFHSFIQLFLLSDFYFAYYYIL